MMTINQFNNLLNNLDNKVEDKMEKVLEETAMQTEMTGKRIVHVRTGKLRKSIETIDESKTQKSVRIGNVLNNVDYAKVEDDRHPFIQEMIDDGVEKLMQNMKGLDLFD